MGDIVHHVDGDPFNNHYDNLVVMSRSEHLKLHYQKREFYRMEFVKDLVKRIKDRIEMNDFDL